MRLAQAVPAEGTGLKAPQPGLYTVESTGAPREVPLGATIEIKTFPTGESWLALGGQDLGVISTLVNGDYEVSYESLGYRMLLQFRQTGAANEYLFGVSMPAPVPVPGAMDDPPITGVWGAETRPPNEPYGNP